MTAPASSAHPMGCPNHSRPNSSITVNDVRSAAPAKSMLRRPAGRGRSRQAAPTIAAATRPGTMFKKNTHGQVI